jgi:hypothetical protein
MDIEFYTKKIRDIKIVAYARFNASADLERKEKFSILCITLLSFSLIVLSIANNNEGLEKIGYSWFNPVSVWLYSLITSIFILVLSVAISARAYGSKSKELYYSALKINEIVRSFEMSMLLREENKIISLIEKYDIALRDFQANHTDDDWKIARYKIDKKNWHSLNIIYHKYINRFYLIHFTILLFSILSLIEAFIYIGSKTC